MSLKRPKKEMYNQNSHLSYFHCDPFSNLPHINLPRHTTMQPQNINNHPPYQHFYEPSYQPPIQAPYQQSYQAPYQPSYQEPYQSSYQPPVQAPVEEPIKAHVYGPYQPPFRVLTRKGIPPPLICDTDRPAQPPGFFDFTDYKECELENVSPGGGIKKVKKRKNNNS